MLYTIWLTSRLSRNYYFLYQHYYSKSNKDKLCNTDYGHPFLIKTTQITGTANTYSTGVTNNGASNGTLTFVVPTNLQILCTIFVNFILQ